MWKFCELLLECLFKLNILKMKIEQIFCDDVLEDYACDYDYVIIMFMIMIRIMIMIMLLHFFK